MQKGIIDASSSMDEFLFDHACERLTKALDEVNSDGTEYRSRGQSVGWRNQSGETTVTLTDGRDLLQKLTPRGSWNLEAELDDDGDALHISLSHHDSPMGETHVLTAARGA